MITETCPFAGSAPTAGVQRRSPRLSQALGASTTSGNTLLDTRRMPGRMHVNPVQRSGRAYGLENQMSQ